MYMAMVTYVCKFGIYKAKKPPLGGFFYEKIFFLRNFWKLQKL